MDARSAIRHQAYGGRTGRTAEALAGPALTGGCTPGQNGEFSLGPRLQSARSRSRIDTRLGLTSDGPPIDPPNE